MDLGDPHLSLPISWAIAERRLDTARRGYLQARGNVMDNDDVTLEDGSVLPVPSDC